MRREPSFKGASGCHHCCCESHWHCSDFFAASPVSGCATHRATLPGEIIQFPPAPTTAESFSFCHGIFAFFATLLSYSLLYLGSYSFFFSKRIAGTCVHKSRFNKTIYKLIKEAAHLSRALKTINYYEITKLNLWCVW